MSKLKILRGNKADLPLLAEGEPALTLDEKRLYVGDGASNIALPNQSDMDFKANKDSVYTKEEIGDPALLAKLSEEGATNWDSENFNPDELDSKVEINRIEQSEVGDFNELPNGIIRVNVRDGSEFLWENAPTTFFNGLVDTSEVYEYVTQKAYSFTGTSRWRMREYRRDAQLNSAGTERFGWSEWQEVPNVSEIGAIPWDNKNYNPFKKSEIRSLDLVDGYSGYVNYSVSNEGLVVVSGNVRPTTEDWENHTWGVFARLPAGVFPPQSYWEKCTILPVKSRDEFYIHGIHGNGALEQPLHKTGVQKMWFTTTFQMK